MKFGLKKAMLITAILLMALALAACGKSSKGGGDYKLGDIKLGSTKADMIKAYGDPGGNMIEGANGALVMYKDHSFYLKDDKVVGIQLNTKVDSINGIKNGDTLKSAAEKIGDGKFVRDPQTPATLYYHISDKEVLTFMFNTQSEITEDTPIGYIIYSYADALFSSNGKKLEPFVVKL
jgi:hypothetical protein